MQRHIPNIEEKRHFLSTLSYYFSAHATGTRFSNVVWEKQGRFCCFYKTPDGIFKLRNLVGIPFDTTLSDEEIERRFQGAKQILREKRIPYYGWCGERSTTTQEFYDHFYLLIEQIGAREEKVVAQGKRNF